MNIIVHSRSTHEDLADHLKLYFYDAKKIDIAVAFATKYGFDFLQQCLENNFNPDFRLVVSVRYPTNLDSMCDFAKIYPGKVWIHLGGLKPQEKQGDRYQLHSKVFKFEYDQEKVKFNIGSHNLTAAALLGVNIEIGACIECLRTDQVARDVDRHVTNCIYESELFEPTKLDFYKTAQEILQGKQGVAESLEDFQRNDCIVILAETDDISLTNESKLQLFFSPVGKDIETAMTMGKKVSLYIYPKGALVGGSVSKSAHQYPSYFEGSITMVNDNSDSAVEQRPINSLIWNMATPTLERGTNVPSRSDFYKKGLTPGPFQVIALLDSKGPKEIPVYHSGAQPKIKSSLQYENRENILRERYVAGEVKDYFTPGSIKHNRFVTKTPSRIVSKITLDIPNIDNPRIYKDDPLRRLANIDKKLATEMGRQRIYGRQSSRKKEEWENEYFYQVSYMRDWNDKK